MKGPATQFISYWGTGNTVVCRSQTYFCCCVWDPLTKPTLEKDSCLQSGSIFFSLCLNTVFWYFNLGSSFPGHLLIFQTFSKLTRFASYYLKIVRITTNFVANNPFSHHKHYFKKSIHSPLKYRISSPGIKIGGHGHIDMMDAHHAHGPPHIQLICNS